MLEQGERTGLSKPPPRLRPALSTHLHDYLVCYDIKHARNLRAVNRYLRGIGVPIQFSVFICRLDGRQYAELIEKLESLVDTSTDDVRIYRLAAASPVAFQGHSPLPKGLYTDSWNFVNLNAPLGGDVERGR